VKHRRPQHGRLRRGYAFAARPRRPSRFPDHDRDPHLGTPLADAGHALFGRITRAFATDHESHRLGRPGHAGNGPSTRPSRRSRRGVRQGGGESGRLRTNPLLWPSHLYLGECSGPNDGVVPANSQPGGEVLHEIEADHWAQIGWWRADSTPLPSTRTSCSELRGAASRWRLSPSSGPRRPSPGRGTCSPRRSGKRVLIRRPVQGRKSCGERNWAPWTGGRLDG